jgi:membrane associated rhomboid family serine protease
MIKTKPIQIWLYQYAFAPIIFVGVLFLFHIIRWVWTEIPVLGIIPRQGRGLWGLFLHTFYHGSWEHLFSNAVPLLFLGTILWMYYQKLAIKVVLWIYLGSGFWLWTFGRDAMHIGASGIVYGLFSFLTLSGLIRQFKPLIAISLLIIFIYGSIIWGIFPIEKTISWEGHLMGLIWGFILSIFFLPEGPQNIPHPINDDLTLLEEKFGKEYWMNTEENKILEDDKIIYLTPNPDLQQDIISHSINVSSTQKNIHSIQYTFVEKSEEGKNKKQINKSQNQ